MSETDEQGCFTIQFDGTPEHSEKGGLWCSLPDSDLVAGPRIRRKVYRQIWGKIFARSQEILHRRHARLAKELVKFVRSSHDPNDTLQIKGEIPTAVISGGDSSSYAYVYQDLCNTKKQPDAYFSHINGRDCVNLAGALRVLISGFTSNKEARGNSQHLAQSSKAKQGGTTVLSLHDLHILGAWYRALMAEGAAKKLVVIFHDTESIPSNVFEDLIHICSNHVPPLPLAFVIGLTTSPEYLQLTLSRSALSSLGIELFQAPSGKSQFEELIRGIFFDLSFEPGLMIGLPAYETLLSSYSNNGSADSTLSTLQLILLEHCFNPLTVLLAESESVGECLEQDTRCQAFLNHLRRVVVKDLLSFGSGDENMKQEIKSDFTSKDPSRVLGCVERLKQNFQEHGLKFRAAFGLLQKLHLAVNPSSKVDEAQTFSEFCRTILDKANTEKWIRSTVKKIGKLPLDRLQELLQAAHHFFQEDDVPDAVRAQESFCFQIILLVNAVNTEAENLRSAAEEDSAPTRSIKDNVDLTSLEGVSAMTKGPLVYSKHAADVATAFEDFFRLRLKPFSVIPLYTIWQITSTATTATDLVNPSILSSITSALMRPHEYLSCDCCKKPEDALACVPDESVAFRRYLDGGKMVNVYDWFETFMAGLEGEERSKTPEETSGKRKSPRRAKKKPKEKKEPASEEMRLNDQEVEEQWRREVQARFLRCFHELDMLGMLKHTGRKPDHVIRTVYDIVD